MFQDARHRERQARIEAEEALNQAQQALYKAEVSQVQALPAEERARLAARDAGKRQPEPEP
jgi:hypothetical protein